MGGDRGWAASAGQVLPKGASAFFGKTFAGTITHQTAYRSLMLPVCYRHAPRRVGENPLRFARNPSRNPLQQRPPSRHGHPA